MANRILCNLALIQKAKIKINKTVLNLQKIIQILLFQWAMSLEKHLIVLSFLKAAYSILQTRRRFHNFPLDHSCAYF